MKILFIIASLIITQETYAQNHSVDTSIRKVKWDSLLVYDYKHFKMDNSDTSRGIVYSIYFMDVQDDEGGVFDGATYFD